MATVVTGTRRAHVIGVVGLLTFVLPLSTDMYLPGLPHLVDELSTTASGSQLTLTGFLVGFSAGQLLFGPLSDRFGRRRPLLSGLASSATASVVCALAPSLAVLVGARVAQGVGAAAAVVVGRAIVVDLATGVDAARLFSMQAALGGLAPIVAPLAGAVVVEDHGWRAVFWVLAGVAALLVPAVLVTIAETRTRPRGDRAGRRRGVPRALPAVVTDRGYTGHALALAFSFGALFCFISGSPFLYQQVLGLSVAQNGVAFAVSAATVAAGAAANASLVRRVPPRAVLRVGLAAMVAAACTLSALTVAGPLPVTATLLVLEVFFLGVGLVLANATALALDRVRDSAGSGAGLLGALQTGVAAVVAPLVGLAGTTTAAATTFGMAACAVSAALALSVAATSATGELATTCHTAREEPS